MLDFDEKNFKEIVRSKPEKFSLHIHDTLDYEKPMTQRKFMSLIRIDGTKCKKDGICVAESMDVFAGSWIGIRNDISLYLAVYLTRKEI